MTFARFRRTEDADVSRISRISRVHEASRETESSLVEDVQAFAPSVRLTIRATANKTTDRAFVAAVWALLREHDGDNLVRVRLIDEDGTAWRVRDRALASPELRRALAQLLAERAANTGRF